MASDLEECLTCLLWASTECFLNWKSSANPEVFSNTINYTKKDELQQNEDTDEHTYCWSFAGSICTDATAGPVSKALVCCKAVQLF